mgnify:CR=1 FL=1
MHKAIVRLVFVGFQRFIFRYKQKNQLNFHQADRYVAIALAYFPFSSSSPGSKGLKAILSSKNSSTAKEVGLGIRS